MRSHRATNLGSAAMPFFLIAALPAFAQNEPSGSSYNVESESAAGVEPQPAVAPERGAIYARLREFEGGISLKREDENASQDVKLEVNSPLLPGDQIWTGEDGRLEVQLADGTRQLTAAGWRRARRLGAA